MSKILDRILKDKKYIKNLVGTDLETDLIQDYMDNMPLKTKPTSSEKANYVGIEFECFSNLDQNEILAELIEQDLAECVQIDDDGSIEQDFGDAYELKILTPEKKLKLTLQKFGKVLKNGKFGVNDSCGLHIHLDMRNRNVEQCYKKLLKFQDVLFALVKKDRWNNEYCEYTRENSRGHYYAISKDAYLKYKTLEVRIHHATLDMASIEKWIKLLLNVIGSKNTPPPVETKNDVLKWAKGKHGLVTYINKNFNPQWFERKKEIAAEKKRQEELRLEFNRQRQIRRTGTTGNLDY